MAVELANAYITLTASARGISKSIGDELGDVDGIGRDAGDRTSKGFLGNFTAGLGGLALAVGGAFAAVGVGTFLKGTIDAASDLNETVSKVGVIFGDSAGTVEKFASTASTAFGQSKKQALDAASTFATFGKSAGLTGQDLAGFSTGLVGMSADFASFFNTSPDQAIEAIGAALRGESEPIRQYGILLDEATLRNRALKLGLVSTTKDALTPQQRVLAAQAEIMAQSSDAQGDFARTSDGLANKQRILSAQFTDVKAKIGQGLLPVMSAIVGFISDKVLPSFTGLGDKVGPIFDKVGLLFGAFKAAFSGEGVTSDGIVGVFERVGVIAKQVFDFVVLGFAGFRSAFSGEGVTSDGVVGVFERIGVIARQVFDFIAGIDWGKVFGEVVDFITPIIATAKDLAEGAFTLLAAIAGTLIQLFKDNRDTIESVGEKLLAMAGFIRDQVLTAAEALSSVFTFLATHMELVKAIAIPLIAAFATYKAIMLAVQAVTFLVTTATTIWTAAQAALNLVMSLNPLVLVAALIAGLVVGVIYAYNHFQVFHDTIDQVWQNLQTAFNWVKDNWPLILAILTGPFGIALLLIINNFDTIKDVIVGVIGWIGDHWQLILAIITGPIGIAVLVVSRNLDSIVDFFTGIPGRIVGALTWIGDTIKGGIEAARDFVWQKIEAIIGYFTGIPGRLAGAFGGMFDGIKEAMRSALNGMIALWNSVPDFTIPSVHVPGTNINVGGARIGIPEIAYLAAGGVVTRPTWTMLGEGGPEAVIPLDKAGMGGGLHNITINTLGKPDAVELAREVTWQMRTAGV